jgi:hypothetical protein
MPYSFMVDVYSLLTSLEGIYISDEVTERCRAIEKALQTKMEAMKKREAFTAYKTAAADGLEREQKRQEYLNMTGIGKDWRTGKETPGI